VKPECNHGPVIIDALKLKEVKKQAIECKGKKVKNPPTPDYPQK